MYSSSSSSHKTSHYTSFNFLPLPLFRCISVVHPLSRLFPAAMDGGHRSHLSFQATRATPNLYPAFTPPPRLAPLQPHPSPTQPHPQPQPQFAPPRVSPQLTLPVSVLGSLFKVIVINIWSMICLEYCICPRSSTLTCTSRHLPTCLLAHTTFYSPSPLSPYFKLYAYHLPVCVSVFHFTCSPSCLTAVHF